MDLGIHYASENNADLLIVTDLDCDRAGIAVKDSKGEYVLLSVNQTGALLLAFHVHNQSEEMFNYIEGEFDAIF